MFSPNKGEKGVKGETTFSLFFFGAGGACT